MSLRKETRKGRDRWISFPLRLQDTPFLSSPPRAMSRSMIWSESPSKRLKAIRSLHERQRAKLIQDAVSTSCVKGGWPYGMPTSVNPWLMMIGISPGEGPDDGSVERTGDPPTANLTELFRPVNRRARLNAIDQLGIRPNNLSHHSP